MAATDAWHFTSHWVAMSMDCNQRPRCNMCNESKPTNPIDGALFCEVGSYHGSQGSSRCVEAMSAPQHYHHSQCVRDPCNIQTTGVAAAAFQFKESTVNAITGRHTATCILATCTVSNSPITRPMTFPMQCNRSVLQQTCVHVHTSCNGHNMIW